MQFWQFNVFFFLIVESLQFFFSVSLHIEHYTCNSKHRTLHAVHCTVHTSYCTLHTSHWNMKMCFDSKLHYVFTVLPCPTTLKSDNGQKCGINTATVNTANTSSINFITSSSYRHSYCQQYHRQRWWTFFMAQVNILYINFFTLL